MQSVNRKLFSFVLVFACLISVQQVRAELVASATGTKFVSLTPLRNGISAITLVWPIDPPTHDRVTEMKAGLTSVMSGGTKSRSPYEIDAQLRLKGIEQNATMNGQNILLTIASPNEAFPEALEHLEEVLLQAAYARGWYQRELQQNSLKLASKTGRPSDVLNEIAHFLMFKSGAQTKAGSDGEFRFGRPSQVILRSGDEKLERSVFELLKKLPEERWNIRLAKWATAITDTDERPFALPTGAIHFEDPDSSEMLILFVKAEEYKDEAGQIGANLLTDYIGGNSGSEMFRIIRQELRAAYAPQSTFSVMDKNRAIASFSATVAADNWPEIHGKITEIYKATRAGKIDLEGLKIQHDQMKRRFADQFFSNPISGARHYLNEYPDGAKGAINLPIFEALETASPEKIISDSEEYLPPLEEYLLILIGGGTAPSEAQNSNGYCALPKNTPLSFCLDELSNVSN
ncbi:hypothetical protein [Roseibium sp. MMSF_3544]|uniref:hypothetical protein n=1 Tax=unclassified Roseibium TaxID=2629323 RepID=UPI00273E2CE5|nr:hypothetical protein [Roseibium sp. MMSF_3544]